MSHDDHRGLPQVDGELTVFGKSEVPQETLVGAQRAGQKVSVTLCVRGVFPTAHALKSMQQREEGGASALGGALIVRLLGPTVPQLKQQQDGR